MRRLFQHNVVRSAALLLTLSAVPAPLAAKDAPLVGRLTTSNNRPVYVNGSKVKSGMTVVSGTELKSPEGVGATVDLGQLGSIDMAPNTHLALTFTEDTVSVELKEGRAVLSTRRGIRGTLSTPDGTVVETDPTKDSSVSGQTQIGVTAAKSGVGAGKVLLGAGAAAAGAGAAMGRGRGRGSNPSPGTPRRN